MDIDKFEIREKILGNLAEYGVSWNEDNQKLLTEDFRELQYKLAQETNPDRSNYQTKVQDFIGQSKDINILKINPYLALVNSKSKEDSRLWLYATSFWSIPVTVGYGRRIRFFVFDRQNHKLIGIIGLCDPVIGLGIRDNQSIGWEKEQKLERLYNCMTAYILGAIPPYNYILGSKLVALTLLFPEVRKTFYHKYYQAAFDKGRKPYLVYIDTLGAFGKSAIYNRLKNWEFVGYTKGQSHIHITANGSWELIKQVVPDEIFNTYKYGDGPNWKMRILKHGLRELDFSENMLSIGWKRGYYRCPLARNWEEFLLGKTNKIVFKQYTKTELVKYWKQRWVEPRIEKLEEKLKAQVSLA